MSTLSSEEQDLFDVGRTTIPRWFFQKDASAQEILGAAAKAFALAQDQIASWWTLTFVKKATGFWLDQHARDRGTRRQHNESDVALQTRLPQMTGDAVTLNAVVAAANAALAADGVAGSVAAEELRVSRAFFHPSGNARRAFWGRGFRLSAPPRMTIVIVCPVGTPDATVGSIVEACRQVKGGGVRVQVENPRVPKTALLSVTPPATSATHGGAAVQFTSSIGGLVSGVAWSVDSLQKPGAVSIGSIDATGLYTPPANVPGGGAWQDVVVTATTIGLDRAVTKTAFVKIT